MATLAQELKKRDPFKSPHQEAYLNLVRTAATLGVSFERLFRRHKLCGAHYNILRIVAGGKAGGVDGLPAMEVRDRLITPLPDITRLVDKLVLRKLVARVRTDEDRRVVLLRITERGQKLVELLREPVEQLHVRQLGHMSRVELESLSRLLEKARTASD